MRPSCWPHHFLLLPVFSLFVSCSRSGLEREVRTLQEQEKALQAGITAAGERITAARRESFAVASSAEKLLSEAGSAAPAEDEDNEAAAEAISTLKERIAQLTQRNAQMKAELEACRARNAQR